MPEVQHYQTPSGIDVYEDWLSGIRDLKTRVRITRRVDRVRDGNFGDHKECRDGVWELRLDFGPGYRVYYSQVGVAVVLLLAGGDKSSQSRDIDRAVEHLDDYKRRLK